MKTALDTNVISELLDSTIKATVVAQLLTTLRAQGPLVIGGVVYAELHARHNTPRSLIDSFLQATGVMLDPAMSIDAWAEAGRANADHHARKRAGGPRGIKPILPDFLIGAHALHHADRLFTLNVADFGDFPTLNIVTI
ncbi:PIN domain protein [Deinococcus aerius]|uniref:PIN domain protein n=1 Tax=Deinococcus aerius TaxID=200253 RepID=A0A2I9DKE8_9DEIO|nr:type II toxin-antitoxin system VapC family toxin [Deinococcus aerius]GBF06878.1 PIN domain protein [Deinococcus aerius]